MQNSLQQLTLGLSGWNSVMRNVEYNVQKRLNNNEPEKKTPKCLRCLFPHPPVDLDFLDTKTPIPRFTLDEALDDEVAAALSPQLAVEAGPDSTDLVTATSTSALTDDTGEGQEDDDAAHKRRGSKTSSSSL
jgi:hypothetical protein